jgi:hypothetical protein
MSKHGGGEITNQFQLAMREETERSTVAHKLVRGALSSEGRRLLIAMSDRERAYRIAKLLVGADLFDSYALVVDSDMLSRALRDGTFALVMADSAFYDVCHDAIPDTTAPRDHAQPRLFLLTEEKEVVEQVRSMQAEG